MFHLCFGGISSTLSSSKSGGTCSTSTSDRNGTFWCFQNVILFSNHQFSSKIKLFCIENRIQWSERQISIDRGTCSTFAFSKNFGTCSTWWNEFHFTQKNMNSYIRAGVWWVFFLIVIKFEYRKEYFTKIWPENMVFFMWRNKFHFYFLEKAMVAEYVPPLLFLQKIVEQVPPLRFHVKIVIITVINQFYAIFWKKMKE